MPGPDPRRAGGTAPARRPSLYACLRGFWERGHRAVRAFQKQHGPLMASAVSFWSLLSLLPLLLLSVAVFGYVLGSSEEAFQRVISYTRTLITVETAFLRDLLQEVARQRGPVGGAGLLVLAWTGSQAVVTLEGALNAQWGVTGRHFLKSRLLALALLATVGALFFLSTAVTGWMAALARWRVPWLEWRLERIPFVWQLGGYLVPLLLTATMFALLYRTLPNVSVSWRSAWYGAVVASPMFEAAKIAYTWYLTRFADFRAAYGSLGALVGLVLWIYYSSVILLLGSEWVRLTEEARKKRQERGGQRACRGGRSVTQGDRPEVAARPAGGRGGPRGRRTRRG